MALHTKLVGNDATEAAHAAPLQCVVSSLNTDSLAARLGAVSEGFSVTLPLPVSANRIWRRGKGGKTTHISKEYAEWKREAAHAVKSLDLVPVSGRYSLLILIPAKDRADADNRVKAVSDLLVACGVIPDDKHAWEVTVRRDETLHARLCRVIVSTAPAAGLRGVVAGGPSVRKHPSDGWVNGTL